MTQEVVVYRNPMEKMFWDFIMSPDGFIFMLVALVYFLSIVVLFRFAENGKIRRRLSRNRFNNDEKNNKSLIGKFVYLVDRYPSVVFFIAAIPAYIAYSFFRI